ncbi:MAG: YraN family protein [Bacteroidetes bacterium]|jgi:putative endonuclease|nr:YraN family protein [Bacteroidota bacterium]
MAEHNDFGKQAEDFSVTFLQEKGYEIIARNFFYQKGEIDIIALFNNQIIVVEVKARNSTIFQEPYEAVNKRKIKLIVSAADAFVQARNIKETVRFDIISVLKEKDGKLNATHIEDAFEAFDAN